MKKGFSILIFIVLTIIINLNSDSFAPLLGKFVEKEYSTIKDEPKKDFTILNSYGQEEKNLKYGKRIFQR